MPPIDSKRKLVAQTHAKAIKRLVSAGKSAARGTRDVAQATLDSDSLSSVRTGLATAGGKLSGLASEAVGHATEAGRTVSPRIASLGDSLRKRITEEVTVPSRALVDAVAAGLSAAGDSVILGVNRKQELKKLRNGVVNAAVAIGAATAAAYDTIQASAPSFSELSPALKLKFAIAGGHGIWRSTMSAEGFYDASIPAVVRNLGKSATLEFVEGKHASHIKSAKLHPELAMDNSNILWERASSNLSRGAANMTGLELAKANVANLMDAAHIVAESAIETAAISGCVGMALEAVVGIGENIFYVLGGERSLKDAALDASKKVAKKGMFAAIGGAAVSVALSCGAGPALTTMAPALVTVGGTMYVVGAAKRISTAINSCRTRKSVEPILLDSRMAPA